MPRVISISRVESERIKVRYRTRIPVKTNPSRGFQLLIYLGRVLLSFSHRTKSVFFEIESIRFAPLSPSFKVQGIEERAMRTSTFYSWKLSIILGRVGAVG